MNKISRKTFLLLTSSLIVLVNNKKQEKIQQEEIQQKIPKDTIVLQENNSKSLHTLSSGLQYIILEDAKNPNALSPKKGQEITVHYTGWLEDKTAPEGKGKKFDSSVDRKDPFSSNIGIGHLIKGWDEGMLLMKVGEKRRLIVPAHLGYGARGVPGVIPPNTTLIFDVELLAISS